MQTHSTKLPVHPPITPSPRRSLRARTSLRAGVSCKEPTKLEIPNLKVT